MLQFGVITMMVTIVVMKIKEGFKMRVVNFYNEYANEWEFGCNVLIVRERPRFAISLGTVEYTDGSFLDIYYVNGRLFGVEYWLE